MSLVSFGLRLALVEALKEAQFFDGKIYNNIDDPVALAIEEGNTSPIVAVYSGDDGRKVQGRDIIGADRSVELTVQVFLPADLKVEIDGEMHSISTKKGGGAFILDMFDRQLECLFTSGVGQWAQIFRNLVLSVSEFLTTPYLIDNGTGNRITAREYFFSFNTLASPEIGQPPTGVWADLIAAMNTHAEYKHFTKMMTEAISSPDGITGWKRAMAGLGLTEAGAQLLGLETED